jgi:hypothetical protein
MSTTQKKYVSLAKLAKYDELLKAKMAADDAKVLKDAKDYADSLKDNYEASGTVATAKQELQDAINSLANGAVADNAAAIAKLNGDANTTGSVAKAVADAAATLQASINAVDSKADQNATDIDTLEGKVDALEKGTYNDSEVRGLIAGNTEAIGELEQTHATDKSALEASIALKADQTALETVSAVANAAVKQSDYDTKVAALEAEDARIAGLVADEVATRDAADKAFDERLIEVETFFKTTDGETLDTALDTLVEIQKYVTDEGAAADQMVKDIAANAKAIEDEVKARGEADTALQNAIDLKADASALGALDGRVGELETASATHATKTEVQNVSDALTQYQEAHAGDYTNAQIDAAIKVVADDVASLGDTYATDSELAQAIADAKTDASNKDAVVLAEAQKASTAVQTALDTHTGNADIHVTAEQKTAWTTAVGKAHEHGNIQVLNGITSDKITEWDKVSAKADATALQAESERAVAKENELSAAIAAFVECSEQDVIDLFNA